MRAARLARFASALLLPLAVAPLAPCARRRALIARRRTAASATHSCRAARGATRRFAADSESFGGDEGDDGEFPRDDEKKEVRGASVSYLERLSSYGDEDGYRLSSPTRYSIKDWWLNLQNLPSSSVLDRVRGHLVANTAFATIVVACAAGWREYGVEPSWLNALEPKEVDLGSPFELSGGILGILLAFRTGQSYDRFWEGRQLWAKVVNRVRATARTSRAYVTAAAIADEPATTAALLRWLEAFPVALKQHLRGERAMDAFGCLDAEERRELDSADNLPLACTYALSARVDAVRRADESDQAAAHLLWWQLESLVLDLQDAIGDAEAIAGTPVPLSYSRHTSRLLSIWTLGSPIILAEHLPLLLVPPATALLSWMLLATEEIGHIIEEPFGIHDDRPKILPLQRYCDIVARDLAEENRLIARANAAKREDPSDEHGEEVLEYPSGGGVV